MILQPWRVASMKPSVRRHCLQEWVQKLPSPSMILKEALSYVSVWNLLLIALFPHDSPIVHYTSLLCSVGGFYLTWIYPRYLPIHYLNLHLGFWETLLMDVVAHQFPRYLVLCSSQKQTSYFYLPARTIMVMYLFFYGEQDILNRYAIGRQDMVIVLLLTELLYFMLCFLGYPGGNAPE